MKDWKFITVGNDATGPNWDKKRQLEDELRGWMTTASKATGEEKQNAEKQIAEIRKELNDVKIKIAHGENKKAGNESINKQEWSMFKGLSKDAEKEVGNSQKEFKSVEELDRWCKQNGYMYEERSKGYYSLTNGKDFKTAHVGNESIGDEYNAEIQRLTKKAEQLRRMGQGRSAMEIEKQIEKLGKELRELGNKKVGNAYIHAIETEIDDLTKQGLSYEEIVRKLKSVGYTSQDIAEYEKYIRTHIGNGLSRARNAIKTKNADITLWNGNDSAYIKEDGHVQYLENNSFVVDEDKYDSQEKAVEELTKKGYRKK